MCKRYLMGSTWPNQAATWRSPDGTKQQSITFFRKPPHTFFQNLITQYLCEARFRSCSALLTNHLLVAQERKGGLLGWSPAAPNTRTESHPSQP
eukprot:2594417-Amphidinium_carterae.1